MVVAPEQLPRSSAGSVRRRIQQHVAPASPGDHVEGESRQLEECGIDVVNAPVAVGFDER
jgi:hypothetical protein